MASLTGVALMRVPLGVGCSFNLFKNCSPVFSSFLLSEKGLFSCDSSQFSKLSILWLRALAVLGASGAFRPKGVILAG